jgi:regulator of protease activity HflC (stomatin/prohibitin superfamily)
VRGLEAAALKENGLLEAETEKQVAEFGLTAAEIEAQTTQLLGQAAADGERLLRQAQADGLKLLVTAFGTPGAYMAYKFAESFGVDTRMVMSERGFLEFLETIAAPKPAVTPASAR